MDTKKYGFIFSYPFGHSFYFFSFFIIGLSFAINIKNVDYIFYLLLFAIAITIFSLISILFFNYYNNKIFVVLFIIVSLISGYTYASIKYYNVFKYPTSDYTGNIKDIKGFSAKVISYNGLNMNRHVYVVEMNFLHDGINWHRYSSKIRLYSYNDKMLNINDTITSTAKIKLYKDIFTNNTEVDRKILSMLEKKSLVGVATSYNYHNIIIVDNGFNLVNYMNKYFIPLRIFIKEALSKHINSVNYSIAQCLLIGDKYILSYSLQQNFQLLGISHILSVSGLHLGIVYFILFSFLSIFPIKLQFKMIISSIMILFIYLPITLYSIPIMRASLMMAFMTVTVLLDRSRNILNTLLFTAFIILVDNPQAIKEISFQFSFLATLSLILYMPIFNSIIKSLTYILKTILSFFIVSIVANIMLLPLISNYFGTITLTSIIANIYAVPLTFFIIILDIITVVLYFIYSPLSIIPSNINSMIIDIMLMLTDSLAGLDILRYELTLHFNLALIITLIMIVISLIINYIFHKNKAGKYFENI